MDFLEFAKILTILIIAIDKQVLNALDEKLASEDCCIVCRSLSEYNHGKVIKIKGKFTCHCTVTDPVVEDLYEAYIFFPLAQDFLTKSRKCTLLCKQKKKEYKYGAFDKEVNKCYCFNSLEHPKVVKKGIKQISSENMVTNEGKETLCEEYCESLKSKGIPYDEPAPFNVCICFNKIRACGSIPYLSETFLLKEGSWASHCPEMKKEHYSKDDIDKYCAEHFLCNGINCDVSEKNLSKRSQIILASYNALCLGCSCNPLVIKDPPRFHFQCYPLPMEKTMIDQSVRNLFLRE